MPRSTRSGLGERKVAKFVKDDEVHPGQMLGTLRTVFRDTLRSRAIFFDRFALDEVLAPYPRKRRRAGPMTAIAMSWTKIDRNRKKGIFAECSHNV